MTDWRVPLRVEWDAREQRWRVLRGGWIVARCDSRRDADEVAVALLAGTGEACEHPDGPCRYTGDPPCPVCATPPSVSQPSAAGDELTAEQCDRLLSEVSAIDTDGSLLKAALGKVDRLMDALAERSLELAAAIAARDRALAKADRAIVAWDDMNRDLTQCRKANDELRAAKFAMQQERDAALRERDASYELVRLSHLPESMAREEWEKIIAARDAALRRAEAAEMPAPVKLALKVVLNHIQWDWQNCATLVRLWIEEQERGPQPAPGGGGQ